MVEAFRRGSRADFSGSQGCVTLRHDYGRVKGALRECLSPMKGRMRRCGAIGDGRDRAEGSICGR